MITQRQNIVIRMLVVFALLLVIPVLTGVQILRIQWQHGDRLQALWSAQTLETLPIPAQRGAIRDAQGRELVGNIVTYTIALDPHFPGIKNQQKDIFLQKLANVTDKSIGTYRQRLRNAPAGSRYVVLERNLSPRLVDALKELSFSAAIFEPHYRRSYHYGSLASHVLGYVNHELRGIAGLEGSYDSYLRGQDGARQVQRDRGGGLRVFAGAPRKQPQNGYTIITTLDAHIQAIAEEELERGLIRSKASRGSAIILNPRTGAVKAIANYPDFDPNNPSASLSAHRRNSAISDLIEPGSTFKLVTAAAALQNGLVLLDDYFDTGDGRRMISGQMMRDHDPLGGLTFADAIRKSSNIATSEAAKQIPSDHFYQYIRNFGFGGRTFIDLPGEEGGKLRKPYEWSAVTQPWMSIGYEIQVTLLQLVQAYAAFANEGLMMRPYVVDRIIDERGRIVRQNKPQPIRQVVRPETVQTLLPVFESVVSDSGTASYAQIDGFRIAGKTGTAQKFIDGRYQTKYLASFAGFFPADQPQYVCLILLDEPRISYYGGFNAGPVFRNIALRLIGLDDHLHLIAQKKDAPPDGLVVPELRGMHRFEAEAILRDLGISRYFSGDGNFVINQSHDPGITIATAERLLLTLSEGMSNETGTGCETRAFVPDVRGLSMRKASSRLIDSGFDIERTGSGTVYAQFPQPGSRYQMGRPVTIRGRARDLPQILAEGGGL